jgi:enoyl-CoA hydratase
LQALSSWEACEAIREASILRLRATEREDGGRVSEEAAQVLVEERRDGVLTLTLNRPGAMNALSRALRAALLAAFRAVARDDSIQVVILTGTGERAFCAGLDLKELAGEGVSTEAARDETRRATAGGDDLVGAIEGCDRPIIGAINGVAITGGFELALACDVLVASTHARFADTHARVGILPGWGLSQKLPRLIGVYRAKELSLTGNFIDAERAERWGLVNRVVAPEELLSTCRQLAQDIRSCVPEVVSTYKRVIDRGFARSLEEGRRIEVEASRAHGRSVTPEQIAARRAQIMARGRSQV